MGSNLFRRYSDWKCSLFVDVWEVNPPARISGPLASLDCGVGGKEPASQSRGRLDADMISCRDCITTTPTWPYLLDLLFLGEFELGSTSNKKRPQCDDEVAI